MTIMTVFNFVRAVPVVKKTQLDCFLSFCFHIPSFVFIYLFIIIILLFFLNRSSLTYNFHMYTIYKQQLRQLSTVDQSQIFFYHMLPRPFPSPKVSELTTRTALNTRSEFMCILLLECYLTKLLCWYRLLDSVHSLLSLCFVTMVTV